MTKQMKPAAFRTSIGGQALIEGILMRGPEKQAIVVRAPQGLVIKEENLKLVRDRHPILGLPLIRGAVTFIDSMVKGVQALLFSADYFPETEESKPGKFDLWIEKHFGSEKMQSVMVGTSVVLALGLTVLLFFLLPTLLAGLLDPLLGNHVLWHNVVEGLTRVVIFLLYLILCSRQRDIKRVFAYHGAEHKTIFCYERGLELTVENARQMPKHHPRCGTSFLFVVIVISILCSSVLFSFVNWSNPLVRVGLHLLLLPLVIGIAYEFNRYVGRHDNPVTNFLARPGMWLQNFTTNEPDDSMLEVAITALKLVLPSQQGKDAW